MPPFGILRLQESADKQLSGTDVGDQAQPAAGEIDDRDISSETGHMSQEAFATPRRSGRVFHRVRIQAQGRSHEGRKFREICETVVVNAHGALLSMSNEVEHGAILVLVNPDTQDEQECRVVFLGGPTEKGQRVGVEFLTPAPRFWGLDFRREDSTPEAVH